MSWVLSQSEKSKLVERYKTGELGKTLAIEFGVSCPAISGILRRRGVKMRSQHDIQCRANCRAFADLGDASAAYWVGFIWADGCVTKGQLCLRINNRDKNHLQRFAGFINANVRPSPQNTSQCSTRCRRIQDDLSKIEIRERKSLRNDLFPWEYIPKINLHHFWRGVVDGDGYYGICGPRVHRIELCGNQSTCEAFCNWCGFGSVTTMKMIYRCAISAWDECKNVISALYEGSELSLDRKAAVAAEIVRRTRPQRPQRLCDHEGCEQPHYGHGLCSRHWYKTYASEKRHLRYVSLGK